MVLADHGFTVQDTATAGLYSAEVCIPPFTRGKKQLSKAEMENASHVHVERVVGIVRLVVG